MTQERTATRGSAVKTDFGTSAIDDGFFFFSKGLVNVHGARIVNSHELLLCVV